MSRGRVFLKGPLTPWSGYGRDVIGLSTALMKAQYDVTLFPTVVNTPLPPEVAYLLTKPVEPPYDLLIHHIDPDQIGLTEAEKTLAPISILWTMWEYLSFGEERSAALKPLINDYNLILGYDDVTCHAISLLEPQHEVQKLIGGYDPDLWRTDPSERDWSGPIKFAMVGMLGPRKNPWVAIEAFSQAQKLRKDFDAELHLKTMCPGLHPAMEKVYPGLKIHYVSWPQEMLRDFYMQIHCYVASSWGEGKNLPAIECSTTGAPAAATNFGGHTEWINEQWSYPLSFDWGEHEPGLISARVRVEDLRDVMLRVHDKRDEARQKGLLASKTLPAMLSWDSVVERLGDRINAFRK